MDWREITDDVGGNWPAEMKSLTLDAISPWISHGKNGCDPAQWKVAAFAMRDALALTTLVSKTGARQFTSLVCCAEAPEVVAVSFSDGRLFELNPFLEAGGPLEPELDCVANWQVFSAVFAAEPGADRIRYQRAGEIREAQVNGAGFFEIRDWHSTTPVDQYLGLRVNNVWQEPVASALPYSAHYARQCWASLASDHDGRDADTPHGWLLSALEELGGSDLAALHKALAITGGKHPAATGTAFESYMPTIPQ